MEKEKMNTKMKGKAKGKAIIGIALIISICAMMMLIAGFFGMVGIASAHQLQNPNFESEGGWSTNTGGYGKVDLKDADSYEGSYSGFVGASKRGCSYAKLYQTITFPTDATKLVFYARWWKNYWGCLPWVEINGEIACRGDHSFGRRSQNWKRIEVDVSKWSGSEVELAIVYHDNKQNNTKWCHMWDHWAWIRVDGFKVVRDADTTPLAITITSVGSDQIPPYKTTDSTPNIKFTTDENAWCRISLSDESYDAMTVNCGSGEGTTTHTCTSPDVGFPGSKTIYLACKDANGNKHTAATNENVEFRLKPMTYYVAPDGDNSYHGNETHPWRTIQKAADTLIVGDTVYIKEGTYNEQVIPQNSGSPGNYITYTAYPGHTVTIDGDGISFSNWRGLFETNDKSYIKISGLRIINSEYFGISVRDWGVNIAHNFIIENNYIHNCQASGIHIYGEKSTVTNVIIDNNEVSEICMNMDQEGITLSSVDTFEVKNNHVHHSYKEGIDAKVGCSNGKIYKNHVHDLIRLGIYVDASDQDAHNIDIYQNVVHDSSEGIGLATEAGGSLENIRIYNNIVYNNGNGFSIHGYAVAGSHLKKNIKVISNTFYNNLLAVQITDACENFENFVIKNNIFSGEDWGMINFLYFLETDVTIEHNLFDAASGIYGSDFVIGDPKSVNPTEADFHLQEDSPAIDCGSFIDAPSDDYDGNPRPQGAGYDIGAYEAE